MDGIDQKTNTAPRASRTRLRCRGDVVHLVYVPACSPGHRERLCLGRPSTPPADGERWGSGLPELKVTFPFPDGGMTFRDGKIRRLPADAVSCSGLFPEPRFIPPSLMSTVKLNLHINRNTSAAAVAVLAALRRVNDSAFIAT